MGDVLTVVGGTFTVAATLLVTSINAETGSVLTFSIAGGGNYSAFPTNPAATTGGQGVGATVNLLNSGTAITGGTVQAGGGPWPAGYRVGDVLQLEGGIYTTPASVLVTATNVGGQVTGISIRTPGSGYSVNPCQPATTFGGHGCFAKVQWTIVGGAMTGAVIADSGGPCHKPKKEWWQVTDVNLWGPGSGPPAVPRNTASGMLNPPGTDFMNTLQRKMVRQQCPPAQGQVVYHFSGANLANDISGFNAFTPPTPGIYTISYTLTTTATDAGAGSALQFQSSYLVDGTTEMLTGQVSLQAIPQTTSGSVTAEIGGGTNISVETTGGGSYGAARYSLQVTITQGAVATGQCADTKRPLSYLWLPSPTDCNATCCCVAGDVVEVPAKSGRLYNVWWAEYVCLDQAGEKLLVALQQQCPFGAAPIVPDGNFLVADDGVTVLDADPWHYLTPT